MIDDDELPPDVIVTLAEFKEKQRHERNNSRNKEQKARGKANGSGDQAPRSPFIMKPSGLYWCNPDGDGDDVFLAGPFQILAETRDVDGSSWGLLLQWKDRDNRVKIWAIPKSLLAGDGIDVRRALLDRGLAIASGTKARNLLSNYLVSQRSDGRVRAVATTGWYGSTFVFPDSATGEPNGEQCFFQTEYAFAHSYNVRGSLEEWQENVARFAVGNSRLTFSLCASLAAILIHQCGFESGGFHFRGQSSIGESTALLVAGSAWGGGESLGFLTSWRATSNGLEGAASVHNDALLCLDEISQVSAKDAGDIAYMLANGSGKNRAARNGSLRKPAQWRLLFLSSGELSLAEKIAEDLRGKRQTACQEVRFVDIPADTGAHGFFEYLHGSPSSQAFTDHLRKTTREYYGTAARAFIAAVAGELPGVAEAVKDAANAFVEDHCPVDADFQVRRVAHRFGYVAAAGEAAIIKTVLPWETGEAAKAAKTCFDAWLAARGGVESAEIRNGICAVRAFVSAHGNSRFLAAWEPAATNSQGHVIAEKIINLAGYRKNVGDAWDFFTSGGWREACAGLDAGMVAKALAERGLLEREDAKHLAKKPNIPGVGRVRVYHVKASILEAGQ